MKVRKKILKKIQNLTFRLIQIRVIKNNIGDFSARIPVPRLEVVTLD